jgi:drug/metabolite transporter (DMT)-like permease
VKATFVSLVIAFFLLIVYAIVTRANIPFRDNDLVPLLAGLGIAVAVGYLAMLESLRAGPLSVVTPIGATAGAMTVFYAFVLLGERPNAWQWVGIPLATLGAIFVSIDIQATHRFRIMSRGPFFAFLAVATGAISNALLRIPVREIGSMAAILFQRTVTVAFIGLVFMVMARKGRLPTAVAVTSAGVAASAGTPEPTLSLREKGGWLALLLAIGVLDAAAFIFFVEGLQRADAWLIGILSQSGRVISVMGGFVLFHERLRRYQWIGVALVVAGLVLAVAG